MLTYEFIDPEKQIASNEFKLVESFLNATGRTQIGWHYMTDITWILQIAGTWPAGISILDAGGGKGPLQYLLAEMGFHVTNIDLTAEPPDIFLRKRYLLGLRKLDSFVDTAYTNFLTPHRNHGWRTLIKKTPLYSAWKRMKSPSGKYARVCDQWRKTAGFHRRPVGRIEWIRGNIVHMPEIKTDTFDAVVSLSAIEHLPMERLEAALQEISRVLKPGSHWTMTTSGTEKNQSWFHEPSRGWCFSEKDLQHRLQAQPKEGQDPSAVLMQYQSCEYLRTHLADFYKRSGNLGMPWGRWDPRYIPVGINGIV
jgi:ubiquinone/menaquinone biosynthesis C-methylase UbiE